MATEHATPILISAFNTDGTTYNNFTLDASGLAEIILTDSPGVSRFGLRHDAEFDNTEPTSVGADSECICSVNMAETALTTQDPKLTVTWTAAAAAGGDAGEGILFQLIQNFIPKVLAWNK